LKIGFWDFDHLAKSAAHSLLMVGVSGHIQFQVDSDDGNGIMAMVLIAMMIVLVMVIIVLKALKQVDSVRQHLCQTFRQLRVFQ
jgi:hypothetical protein